MPLAALALSDAPPLAIVGGCVFAGLLAVACVTDTRERRVPNRLVVALFVTGLVFTLVNEPSVAALGRAMGACALGFAIWLPLYALRMLGAGDVKLFAAAAVWLTPGLVLRATWYTALAGGLLSVLWLVLEYGAAHGLYRSVLAYRQPVAALRTARVGGPPKRHVPYGIAMAIGLSLAMWLPRFA